MAAGLFDITKRPLPTVLAVAALLGWIVAIWSMVASATQKREFTERTQQLVATEAATAAQLQELRRTRGTLADLQDRVTRQQQRLEDLRAQQQQATAALDRIRGELDPAKQRLSELQAQIDANTSRLSDLKSAAGDLSGQAEQARRDRRLQGGSSGPADRAPASEATNHRPVPGQHGPVGPAAVSTARSERSPANDPEHVFGCEDSATGWICTSPRTASSQTQRSYSDCQRHGTFLGGGTVQPP